MVQEEPGADEVIADDAPATAAPPSHRGRVGVVVAIVVSLLALGATSAALTLASREGAPLQPTRLPLSAVVDGAFRGPTAFGTWPVGHADCTSYATGTVCVTPTRAPRLTVRPPGGRNPAGENLFGTHRPLEVAFDVANTARQPFLLAVDATNTQIGFVFSTVTFAVGADPSARAPGCLGVPSGYTSIPGRTTLRLCLLFPDSLIPSGAYGPHTFQFLTFGGIAQWASHLQPAPGPPGANPTPLVYAQPLPLPVAADEQGVFCSGVHFESTGCGWPGEGLRFHALLEDLDGRSLDYQHLTPLPDPRRRTCLRAAVTATCDMVRPLRSSGPILLVLRFANGLPYHWRVGIEDAALDVQLACTPSGCTTERLAGRLVPTAPGAPRCATDGLALLAAARAGRQPSVAFCVRFDAPKGAVAFGLQYAKHVVLHADELRALGPRWRGVRYQPGDDLVPFAAGYAPPGPF